MVNKLREDFKSSPIIYIIIFLLIATACISFPSSFLERLLGRLFALGIIRLGFGILGIVTMLVLNLKKPFAITVHALKNWDILLVALLIAVNNFPIIALSTSKAAVHATSMQVFEFVFFCFMVSLFEEVFFRGLILSTLLIKLKDKKNGALIAIILSSLIFGLIHFFNLSSSNFAQVFLQVGYTFLNGLVFALLFYLSKNIYFPIICHALFNIGGLMIENLGSGEIWNTPTIIITIILGLASGVYLFYRERKHNKKLSVINLS